MRSISAGDHFSSNRQVKAAMWFLTGGAILFLLTSWILNERNTQIIYAGLGVLVVVITIRILNNWRDGFYFFLVWLLFEDLIRKYMGNNMLIYFGKDYFVAVAYLSFLIAMRHERIKLFKPPFYLALSLFVWLGLAQAFNPNSPSFIYSVLGLKLYFYYVPLIYLGYAIIQTEEDLRKFLVFNVGLAGVIALMGVIQSIVGLSFLNPMILQDDIAMLGNLTRVSPISGMLVSRPTSVFVSDGRFAAYMVLSFIVSLGAAGYLLMRSPKGRMIVFPAIALTAIAGVMSGSRGAFLYVAGSAVILAAAMLWGAPWKWGQGSKLYRAIQRSAVFIVLALVFMIVVYPEAITARWALYSETLSPDSAAYELDYRVWDYPVRNFQAAFDDPNWLMGNGIGTASLGVQYVTRIMGVPATDVGVESGYGVIVVELGLAGLFMWIVWSISIIASGWKVARQLKQTPYFPVAISILWFTFVLLILNTFGGFQAFQNYVNNAYLWLLLGVLFRLPTLAGEFAGAAATQRTGRGA